MKNIEITNTKQPIVLIQDYKGFGVRKGAKGGYIPFRLSNPGYNLGSHATVEAAVEAIYVDAERLHRQEESMRRIQEATNREKAEKAERERLRLEAVLACVQPVREFVHAHGLDMLRDCIARIEWEEKESKVPANWEELVELCRRIAEKRTNDQWCTDIGDVDVSRHGVTEYIGYNSDYDDYMTANEYGLQEYIDAFWIRA